MSEDPRDVSPPAGEGARQQAEIRGNGNVQIQVHGDGTSVKVDRGRRPMDPRRRRFWKIAAVVGLGLLGLVLIALRLLPAPGPVLEVVPGWYVLKRLPTLTNRAPAWPMQLRISIGGTVIPVPNLKRQVLLVGDRGDVSRVAQNGEAMRALQAWATGPEEKNVIEAFDQPPRSVPTRRLRAGEHFSIEFVHGSITERLCSDTVRPRSGVQTISLNQRSLSAASALR